MSPTNRVPRPAFATVLVVAAALLALGSPARAGVIKVPGDYATLQVEVNNATHGDVILIQAGFSSAGPVEIVDKALTLVVDQGSQGTVPQVKIRDLAPDHNVMVRGLGADGNAFPLGPNDAALVVTDCQGRVTVEGSTLRGANGWFGGPFTSSGHPGAQIDDSSSVAFSHCLIVGGRGLNTGGDLKPPGSGAPGLDVDNANISVAFCELSGGDGGDADGDYDWLYGGGGGAAIRHDHGGTLHVTGSLLSGGDGGNGSCDIDFFQGWVCGTGADGEDGMSSSSPAVVAFHHGITFVPGLGGGSPEGEEPSEDGRLVDGPVEMLLPSASRDFTVPAAKREGQTAAFVLSGEPGDVALVWISLGPYWDMMPPHHGVFLVDIGAPVNTPLLLGPTGLAGDLTVSFTVPALPSGIDALPIHAQGLFRTPVGKILLGPSSVLTLLDASF